METLKTNSQFERVRKAGRTWASGPVVLNAAPNGLSTVRCGFIAAKKVGNAVQRNRARRLIREAVRLRISRIKPGWDVIWIARASIVEADARTVSAAVEETLARATLFATVKPETDASQSRIMYMDGTEVP